MQCIDVIFVSIYLSYNYKRVEKQDAAITIVTIYEREVGGEFTVYVTILASEGEYQAQP